MGIPSFACVYPLFILTMSPLAGENYPVTSVSPCPEKIIAMSKEVTKWPLDSFRSPRVSRMEYGVCTCYQEPPDTWVPCSHSGLVSL